MFCAQMVHLALHAAAAQPLLTVKVIQVDQFTDVGMAHGILGVPTTIMEPGLVRFSGSIPGPYFATQVLSAAITPPR